MRQKIRLLCATAIVTLSFGTPALQADTGAYLSAKNAARSYDFENAARFYDMVLQGGDAREIELENALAANVGWGNFGAAQEIAAMMVDAGIDSQLSFMVRHVAASADGGLIPIAAVSLTRWMRGSPSAPSSTG